ncbi:uracil-xanthine permease family protein [Thalassotalea atypica]|uniref:uracil-xanthine permease family protein n=1 Tax=Thalassotalea atypica TaxID=2054316 RepID=UPI0025732C86|nr:uracil-xanthine permease family protein [Thalassotalea atypica]
MNQFNFKTPLLGLQMLFVAFGALVLVPLLTGLDTNVALFTAGVGTLVFQLVTKRQVPIFLASSFAFIAPISFGVANWGIAATMSGLIAAGLLYVLLSFVVAWRGNQAISRILPPVVVAPVIMVIGLNLAPVGVNMALGKTGDGAMQLVDITHALIISLSALCTTIAISLLAKGMLKLVPILGGLLVGYMVALTLGYVDFAPVIAASWFAIPHFVAPQFHWEAILFILPVAIAPAVEHVGDIMAISNVTGKDFLNKPGLKRTLLGDGLATTSAALFGGPPNTTYSEVTGAVALTKAFNPVIMTWTAVFAIALSFVGKSGAILSTVPVPVMGGIMVLLFGTIAVIGMKTLVNAQVDLGNSKNMTIVAVTLVFGLGGMHFDFGVFQLKGIALAAISAIALNLLLPSPKHSVEESAQ